MKDVAAWRRDRRGELLARRQALDPAQRHEWNAAFDKGLRAVLADRATGESSASTGRSAASSTHAG